MLAAGSAYLLIFEMESHSGTTGPHHAQLIVEFLVETGFYHIGQAGLKLLTL